MQTYYLRQRLKNAFNAIYSGVYNGDQPRCREIGDNQHPKIEISIKAFVLGLESRLNKYLGHKKCLHQLTYQAVYTLEIEMS